MLNDVERIKLLGIKQPFLRIMGTWSSEDLGTGSRHRAAAETVSRFTGPTNHGKESSKQMEMWHINVLSVHPFLCACVYICVCGKKLGDSARNLTHVEWFYKGRLEKDQQWTAACFPSSLPMEKDSFARFLDASWQVWHWGTIHVAFFMFAHISYPTWMNIYII